MSDHINAVFESMQNNRDSPEECENILRQFMSYLLLDWKEFFSEYNENDISQLVQLFMFPLENEIKSLSQTEEPKTIIIDCVKILYNIAISSPNLYSIVVNNSNIPNMIKYFYSVQYTRFFDDETFLLTHILPIIKLLAFLSLSSHFSLENIDLIQLLVKYSMEQIKIIEFQPWVLTLFSGMAFHSETCLGHMKHNLDFLKLRGDISKLLSSPNVQTTLGSLSLLIQLVPTQIDIEPAINVSIHTVSSSKDPLLILLSNTVLHKCIPRYHISKKQIRTLLESLMIGVWECSNVLSTFIDYSELHQVIINQILKMNVLFNIINSLLDYQDSYVSISGSSFLLTLFDDSKDIVLSKETMNVIKKAINLTLKNNICIEKKESSIVLLRLMIKSNDSAAFISLELQNNEDALFLDFQRAIESNLSFISIQYFLLFFDSLCIVPQWKDRISDLVLDSQFPMLVVHVLNESRNRLSIKDALRAHYVFTNSLEKDIDHGITSLNDSIVSAFLLSNRKRYQSIKDRDIEMKELKKKYLVKKEEIINKMKSKQKEFNEWKMEYDSSSKQMTSAYETKRKLSEENEILTKQRDQLIIADHKYMKKIKAMNTEMEKLKKQISVAEASKNDSSLISISYKSIVESINQIENEIQKHQEKNVALTEENKQLIKELDTEKKLCEQSKAQLQNIKKSYLEQKSIRKKKAEEIAKSEEEETQQMIVLQKLKEKTEKMEQKKALAQEKANELTKTVEVESLKIEKAKSELEYEKKTYEEKLAEYNILRSAKAEKNRKREQQDLIIKTIHKVTQDRLGKLEKIKEILETNQS